MSNIDSLKNVPEISFVDTNVDNLLNTYVNTYQEAYKEETGNEITLYPTDKERIWLYTAALFMYQALIGMDLSAKQNFLKYATKDYLDNLGVTRFSTKRDGASHAIVPVKFVLAQALSTDRTVPIGTRVSAGDDVFFATTTDCIITAGETEATFILKCVDAGAIGSGYEIGAINTLVDSLPYIQSVSNTEISQGGTDEQGDDSYTQEIYETPEGYAVAGPKEAYEYRAKSYSQAIEDVVADSPDDNWTFEYTFGSTTESPTINDDSTIAIDGTNIATYALDLSTGNFDITFTEPVSSFSGTFPRGGVINIVPLLQNAELPTDAFLSGLKEFISADKHRPLTDNVQCKAPTQVEYSTNLKYWIDATNSANAEAIKTAVDEAVSEYVSWQDSKLARAINPDELTYLAKKAGAKRLEISEPIYKKIEKTEIAKCTSITTEYQGLED